MQECLSAQKEWDESSFRSAVLSAAKNRTPFDFTGCHVVLSEALKFKKHDALELIGGTLVGECHSIFIVNSNRSSGPPALTLKGTTLQHTFTSEDRREVGAAVFAMSRAKVVIDDCSISSQGGFALW